MTDLFTEPLIGKTISLYPFEKGHLPQLRQAAEYEEIWTHNKVKDQDLDTFLNGYFKSLEAKHFSHDEFPFVVIRQSDKAILGSSRFYDLSISDKRLAIGFTWYTPSVWGTKVNPETKLLLLQHVFESLDFNRVEFHVDSRNKRSLNAMKKLGALEEGLLRQHKIVQADFVRDTVLFSIVKSDWESVKKGLEQRLG